MGESIRRLGAGKYFFGEQSEVADFASPSLEKKSFASFRFRPKGLKDLDTLEDAYKVMDQLDHFTQKSLMESIQRRGPVGHHSQMIPPYEGKSRARNLLEKAWMRALLKSNFGPAPKVTAHLNF